MKGNREMIPHSASTPYTRALNTKSHTSWNHCGFSKSLYMQVRTANPILLWLPEVPAHRYAAGSLKIAVVLSNLLIVSTAIHWQWMAVLTECLLHNAHERNFAMQILQRSAKKRKSGTLNNFLCKLTPCSIERSAGSALLSTAVYQPETRAV